MNSKLLLKVALFILISLALYGNQAAVAQAQSGNINWNGWNFDYEIGVLNDGLAIENVTFQGKQIMGRGNFPSMPVYYENNSCGPYLDRLDNDLEPVPWANNATLVSREFTINGEQWYELGIREFIGQYDIYQVWYFNGNGIIDAHLFSRGIQCNVYHEHWPHWRFDFDIAGSGNDQILRQTPSGMQAYPNEFNVAATAAVNHGWVVQDTITGDSVTLSFDDGQWNVAGTVVPEDVYGKNRVIGRQYDSDEQGWHTTGHASLPPDWNDGVDRVGYGNNENINDEDVVLWYSGYLPHLPSDGAGLWHSTGVRITVAAADLALQNPGDQVSFLNEASTLALNATFSPNASVTFGASGLPTGLSINSSTGVINGTPTAAGSYSVTITIDDGQGASDQVQFTWEVSISLIEANFDSGTDGFAYIDDAFRDTDSPAYASGARTALNGFNGGGLQINLGAVDDNDIFGISGGWQKSFSLTSPQNVDLSLRYKMDHAANFEADEYSQVLVLLDDVLIGELPNDYIAQITGNGNGGNIETTGWQLFQADLGQLDAGNHTLTLGGYNNKKTYSDEYTHIIFDDVNIGPTFTNQPPILVNPGAQTNTVNTSVALDMAATDPDSSDLSFTAAQLPTGLTINPGTGQVSGTPTTVQTVNTTVSISDGNGGTDAVTFVWTITAPPNQLPQITNPGDQSSIANDSINLQIDASDLDDQTLVFSATNLPSGLLIDEDTGLISGALADDSDGTYTVEVTVSDGEATASTTFTWLVEAFILLGDVDCSNVVDSVDALFILQQTVSQRTIDSGGCPLTDLETQLNFAAADVNGNEEIDAVDALFILQCTVDINNVFCPAQ